MTTPVEGQLGVLEGAGLIELLETDPELEYLFRHVLIQDAAYDSLLRTDRRRLHRLVGETLEQRYPDRRDELAPVLGLHFEQAGDRDRAVEYLVLAGDSAHQRFANTEARGFYGRAATLMADAGSEPEAIRKRVEIGLRREEASLGYFPTEVNLALIDSFRADAEALGDSTLLARLHVMAAVERALRGEQLATSDELRHALEQGLSFAEASGDPEALAYARVILGEAKFMAADYEEAVALLEEAVPALKAAGHLSAAGHHGGSLASAHAQLGAFGRAHEWIERSDELARRSGDPLAISDVGIARGLIAALEGDPAKAIAYASEAAATADAVDNFACAIVARALVGDQCLLIGDAGRAIPVLEQAAELAQTSGMVPEFGAFTNVLLDSARAQLTRTSPTLDRYARALQLVRASHDRLKEAELLRQRARDRMAAGHETDLALADFAASEAIFDRLGARPSLAQTLQEHGETLRQSGRSEEARPHLDRAAALLAEMG